MVDQLIADLPFIVPMNWALADALNEELPDDPEQRAQYLRTTAFGTRLRAALDDSQGTPYPGTQFDSRLLTFVSVGTESASISRGARAQLLPGQERVMAVIVTNDAARPTTLVLEAETIDLAVDESIVRSIYVSGAQPNVTFTADGRPMSVPVAIASAAATLEVQSPQVVRWTVTDSVGNSYYPKGALTKCDSNERGFFHTDRATLTVPADTALHVSATRGLEFVRDETSLTLGPGATQSVNLNPVRWVDSRSLGWMGGDLHIHMNYGGTLVATPCDALLMQAGEDLEFANFVAGNMQTSHIFDGAALTEFVGLDLPGHHKGFVARLGVEYRNDLLGHMNAVAVAHRPELLYTGFEKSDHPHDHPANLVGARALRDQGASVAYCHPVSYDTNLREGDSPEALYAGGRTVEARELVVDAALGAINSIDVMSNLDDLGAAVLYRRLLGAGNRLAATAGTDVMLSLQRADVFGNPPGYARMYALVEGDRDGANFAGAIKAGRTFVTNGPWLTLDVQGVGPGGEVDLWSGESVTITATSTGPAFEVMRLWTIDGVVAEATWVPGGTVISVMLQPRASTFVLAEVIGSSTSEILGRQTFALTSPVYLLVDAMPVANPADVEWCISATDLFDDLVVREGIFASDDQLRAVRGVIAAGRNVYEGRLTST
jgi:hypothetical protein